MLTVLSSWLHLLLLLFSPCSPSESGLACAQVICCGSDGITYPTPCDMPDNVTCIDYNECPGEGVGGGFRNCAQVICCGSDGITYPTPCDNPDGVTCVDYNECQKSGAQSYYVGNNDKNYWGTIWGLVNSIGHILIFSCGLCCYTL